MAKTNIIDYDQEYDILYLSKKTKVKSSIDVGDFIIDIDHDGSVSGIEILDVLRNLGMTAEQLSSLEKGSMSITYKPKQVYITLILKFK